ncbi:MAG: hypothetical protein GY805_13095 [Chloroflexi bacterium]|nr:hypothetical protein [Chloroflexota bacterium]
MGDLSLSLLGGFSAVYAERPLNQFRTKAVQALLITLVCQREQPHSREGLMALLWPELPTKSAQGNLRHALYHLRQAIPEVSGGQDETIPFLLADRQTIQVNPNGRFKLDIVDFEALTSSQASLVDLETAVSLYRADFLSDFYLPDSPDFESWAQARRADLRRRFLNALMRLTEEQIKLENFERAEEVARRQLEIDNLSEEAHRQLMRVLTQNGRRTDALNHYQTMRQLLQDELQIEPSAETETLITTIRAGELPSGKRTQNIIEDKPTAPHNLPPQRTPFVGRQAELDALDHFLTDEQIRLINITGSGGTGKTRLALAVAEQQRSQQRFRHGIFFVPLAHINDHERIISAIATAMEFRLEQGEAQLLDMMRAKEILLLLDNFEQLVEGGDIVVRLLQAAPQLKILLTSRERLRLQGEQLYPIQGLQEADASSQNDALQLFLQAARRVQPDFQETADNTTSLHQICKLVEGMPLALELAAAWIDLLAPAEIVSEIQRNLDFLATDLRDVPARHRSIRAVFDGLWKRLSPDEQQLLAQVTIFEGGFTREAVTAVTNASLRDLAMLVHNALLTFDTVNGRYNLHRLLRQYAVAYRKTDDALQARHAEYYAGWLVNQLDRLIGAEQTAAARQVQVEMDNVRTAVIHLLQQERFTELDTVTLTLCEYYRVSGQLQEGIGLFQRIYDALSSKPNLAPITLFWTLIRLGELYGLLNQIALTKRFNQQAKVCLEMPFFHHWNKEAEQASLLHQEGYVLLMQEPTMAVQLFRQSQTLLEILGDRVLLARSFIGMSRAARNEGDLELAGEAARKSFSLAQALSNPLLQIEAQLVLGHLASFPGNYTEAEEWLNEGIAQLRQINHPHMLWLGLIYLYKVQRDNGRFEAALQTVQELQQVCDYLGNFMYQAKLFEAWIWMDLGEYKRSVTLGQEAIHAAQAKEANRIVAESRSLLAMLALVQENMIAARTHLQALESSGFRRADRVLRELICHTLLNAIEGETAVAQQSLKQMIQLSQPVAFFLARTLAVAACLHALEGESEQAIMLYAVAQQHPYVANSRWYADVIGSRITAVSANLSPVAIAAAQARGERMDMWETAESWLRSKAS